MMDTDALRQARERLIADPSLEGRTFCEAYSNVVDEWLRQRMARAVRRMNRRKLAGAALVAVGSYGRRELCPHSDIDLVILHDDVRGVGTIADALWHSVWDAQIELDHAAHTPEEALLLASADVDVAIGLLAFRPIAGDGVFAARVRADVQRRWTSSPRTSIARLREHSSQRWSRFGDLTEAEGLDVKRSRGGLEDVETLRAAASAAGLAIEEASLKGPADDLLRVRVAVHLSSGRSTDRLGVGDRATVARRLGLPDAAALMSLVTGASQRVVAAGDDLWHRVDELLGESSSRPSHVLTCP